MIKRILFFSICIALLCSLIGFIHSFGKKDVEKIFVGVVMPGGVNEVGFNGTHYQGIKQASDELGLGIILKENVREYSGECEKSVRELIAAGVKIIVLASFYYTEEIKQLIENNPDVHFYSLSKQLRISNCKSYFARVYQARYLSGIVAGLQTATNNIGYVAAMNNAEVNRGINAFTLGVKRVNPEAKVHVAWTGSWDDAEKERRNVEKLYASTNADVIAYHQNQMNVIDAADSIGIYSIGYNDVQVKDSSRVLTTAVTNWEIVYKELLQDYLQQKNMDEIDYWLGIEVDAVGLGFYSRDVSDSMKVAVQNAIKEMKNGRDVFYGKIFDNKGVKRSEENEVIGDEFLRYGMDWFVEGVVFLE